MSEMHTHLRVGSAISVMIKVVPFDYTSSHMLHKLWAWERNTGIMGKKGLQVLGRRLPKILQSKTHVSLNASKLYAPVTQIQQRPSSFGMLQLLISIDCTGCRPVTGSSSSRLQTEFGPLVAVAKRLPWHSALIDDSALGFDILILPSLMSRLFKACPDRQTVRLTGCCAKTLRRL